MEMVTKLLIVFVFLSLITTAIGTHQLEEKKQLESDYTQLELEYSYAMEMLDGFILNRDSTEDQLDKIKEIQKNRLPQI